MSDPPTPLSMERGGKGKTAIPEEEKADEPSILPMTPESKQLATEFYMIFIISYYILHHS